MVLGPQGQPPDSAGLAQTKWSQTQTGMSQELMPTHSSPIAPFSPQQDSYPAHLTQLCQHHHNGGVVLPEHPPEILRGLSQWSLRGDVGLLMPVTNIMVLRAASQRWGAAAPGDSWVSWAPWYQGARLTIQL